MLEKSAFIGKATQAIFNSLEITAGNYFPTAIFERNKGLIQKASYDAAVAVWEAVEAWKVDPKKTEGGDD